MYLPRSADLRDLQGLAANGDLEDDGRVDYDDYDDDYDDYEHEDRPDSGQRPAGGTGGRIARTLGEVLVTFGMVVLLFVVYEVYVTNLFSAQKQASATDALNQEWGGGQRDEHYDLTDGRGIAKMYIPAFGADYHFTIIEGTTDADLAAGPGHYVGTPLPGEPGNFAVAGHRVGQGDPFNDLDLLVSCDAIVVETASDWFVYRVLPMRGEISGWATGQGTRAQCSGVDGDAKVTPLDGLYASTVGQETVLPSETDVIVTVPHYPDAAISVARRVPLLTLTTCTPRFSSTHRLIVHAVLVKQYAKTSNEVPAELKETG